MKLIPVMANSHDGLKQTADLRTNGQVDKWSNETERVEMSGRG